MLNMFCPKRTSYGLKPLEPDDLKVSMTICLCACFYEDLSSQGHMSVKDYSSALLPETTLLCYQHFFLRDLGDSGDDYRLHS